MPFSKKIKSKLHKLGEKYRLKFIVVFGSTVSGNMKEDSDIDIAILSNNQKPISFKTHMNIYAKLAESVEEDGDIDLVDLARTDILFAHEITLGGKLLYGDEEAYLDYKSKIFNKYVDSKSLRELEKLIILKKQKRLGKFLSNAKKRVN